MTIGVYDIHITFFNLHILVTELIQMGHPLRLGDQNHAHEPDQYQKNRIESSIFNKTMYV